MTVHLIRASEPKPSMPTKRKVVEVIALLKPGHAMSASEIAAHCDITPYNVASTLELLAEYDLIRFAGKGRRAVGGGHQPATWRWV